MKRLACVVVLVSMALTGCGGSLCEEAVDTGENVSDKVDACSEFSDFSEPNYTVNQCEADLKGCTDQDQEKLEKYLDCLNDLPTCTPNTSEDFGDALFLCFFNLGNVSEACGVVSTESLQRAIASHNVSR